MQSRQRAPPFWLDWLGEGSISSGACCTATHSSWLNSRIYLSAILFSAKNPFPTSPPDDFVRSANSKGLIWSEVVGTFALSNKALLGEGVLLGPPIFNHYSWRRPALRYGRTRRSPIRNKGQRKCKREGREKIPDPEQSMLLTQPQICWMKVACLLYSQPRVRRKWNPLTSFMPYAVKKASEAGAKIAFEVT